MATLVVLYPHADDATFDHDYYIAKHIPLAHGAWCDFGLETIEVLPPAAGPQPFMAVTIIRFMDQGWLNAALSSPDTAKVIGDVANFTNVSPTMYRADD
ncbi:EthD family reductase [Sphingopyxis sp.]|jgi:uncharacterized protein (TIGR02118 family)|uniref:EthD family reductase n=1 Tax=Sphingopyxis sp. TaxID=1908224 RepID=UPI002DF388A4|nr:EthD family reductase [Sphingopyxis sp.]